MCVSFFSVSVSDELSLSSGSSSHGVSRTPSPPSSSYSLFNGNPAAGSSSSSLPPETYSRKVFVGGLPPDIDQGTQSSHCLP